MNLVQADGLQARTRRLLIAPQMWTGALWMNLWRRSMFHINTVFKIYSQWCWKERHWVHELISNKTYQTREQGKRKYDDAFIYSLVMRRRLGKANWSLLNSRCELLLHLSINCPLITPSSHQDPSALTHPSSSPSSSPASAQLSDIIFGTALVAALPCNTQRKVPLLFPRYGPVISLPQNRGRLRRLLQGRVAQRLLLPDNGEEVCQGVRGGETERRRVWELCAGLPGVVVVVLHCNITERTPLEGIWGQEEMNVTLHANSYRKC